MGLLCKKVIVSQQSTQCESEESEEEKGEADLKYNVARYRNNMVASSYLPRTINTDISESIADQTYYELSDGRGLWCSGSRKTLNTIKEGGQESRYKQYSLHVMSATL